MDTGINPRLLRVVKAVNNYCQENGVQYDIACDESDLQGIKLFQKNRRFLQGLLHSIDPVIEDNSVHLETENVRGGTILAFSLEALAETKIEEIIKSIGEHIEPLSFRDRVNLAISRKPKLKNEAAPLAAAAGRAVATKIAGDELESTAKSIVGGDDTEDAEATTGAETGASTGTSKGASLNFESRIAKSMGLTVDRSPGQFKRSLRKALVQLEYAAQPQQPQQSAMSGMATSMSSSPDELFNRFAKSLQVLGKQMGIGPLQDRLREQGIKWKKSDDGMNVILYVQNAATNAPQPVARISAEVLEKPNEFEKALKDILDFSKGEAPGAFQQQQDAMRDQEKAIRDIAKSVSPEQQSEVAAQMHGDQQALAQQPGPEEGPLNVNAAQRAASLK
jgi:hypothetical protein